MSLQSERSKCPLCNERFLADLFEVQMQACHACAHTLGIVPMPPPLRPRTPCRRCNGNKFTRIIPREYSVERARDGTPVQRVAPMFATQPPQSAPYTTAKTVDVKIGVGLLETYVCWGCNAVEWYCHGVQQIPIHPHLNTDLIDLDESSEGPFR